MRHMIGQIGQPLWRSLFFANVGSGALGDGAGGDSTSADGSTSSPHREIGPIGTAARLVLGGYLVGSVIYGQLATHNVRPATWALGLIGFPALVLAWHAWRIRRHPARFSDASPLSFVIGGLLFLALWLTWWYAPALSVTSDAALIFFGGAMLLTARRGYAGCEILAPSNWLLRRHDQIACALFAPIDMLEQRGVRS
jgi:hypothetical protein